MMKVFLAGRAAEQVVFGRVTNGAANDLEKATDLARSMVFEYGMSESSSSRTMRADNYALSEETKRLRDAEQARLTDEAYEEAIRLLDEAPRASRPARGGAAREGDAEPGRARRRCSPTSSPSRAAPRRSARRSAACRGCARRESPGQPIASPRGRRGSTTSASPSRTSTRRSPPTSGCSAPSSRVATTVESQGVEAVAVRVGEGRVELLASLGADTPVGRFLARRGPGMHHVAYEVDDLPRRARATSQDEGAELIDDDPRPGLFGMQVAFVHPSPSTASSRSWSRVADRTDPASRSASTAARSWARSCDVGRGRRSSRRSAAPRAGRLSSRREDGRYTVALARVVYVKRFSREGRVGFGGG